MSTDSLDTWRQALRPKAKEPNGTEQFAPPEPSGAGDAEEKQPTRYRLGCIELRPARGLWSMPTYGQLIDVLFDGKPASFIALVFLHQVVVIKGRNLGSIVAGLRMRTQWLIEQHSPASPPAPGEPFIEKMEFITEDIPAVVAALRAGESPAAKKPAQTAGRGGAGVPG